MATRFEPLKIARDDVFGVRLSGTVGRQDKRRLEELAEKCLDRGHLRVLLDLSGLGNLGGGGARVLAEFQGQLVAAGGGALIVGAGEVVQHFLAQKFVDVPLDQFATVEEALDAVVPAVVPKVAPEVVPEAVPEVVPEVAPVVEPVDPLDELEEFGTDEFIEVGAMSFYEDDGEDFPKEETTQAEETTRAEEPVEEVAEDVIEDTAAADIDDMFDDAPESPAPAPSPAGRRKSHQYTSLSDAVASLGSWTDDCDHGEFNQALGNLLYSHGLAEETLLMVREGVDMVDPSGERRIPFDSAWVSAVADSDRPLTLMDLPDEAIDDDDAAMLEILDPDIILPVNQGGELRAMILLKRDAEEHEYGVAESFALELLMRVLAAKDEVVESHVPVTESVATDEDEAGTWSPDGTSPAEVLLQLALDLPEALDRPHFWRIFARHCWPILPVRQLGFLAPDRTRPQIMVGGNDSWMGLELGAEKLQLFFQSMEMPVAVGNMPSFFVDVRDELDTAGAEWIVALKWENTHLGTVLLQLDPAFHEQDPAELLEELFMEMSRLLWRYDGTHDNADVNLELVRILVSQREKNCFGSDSLTATMVKQVGRLARVMAFPPEQERDLIYGCLLRDIGLFDRNDEFLDTGKTWTAAKREVFRRHPDEGVALLAGLKLPQSVVEVVRSHHERFDGKGFPRGLEGHRIPLAARVVVVAEHFAEMVTGADGQAPLSPEAAAELLRRNAGSKFDPDLVDLFLKAVLPAVGRKPGATSVPVPMQVLEPVES